LKRTSGSGSSQGSKEARIKIAKQLLDLPKDLVPPETREKGDRTAYPLANLYILATARLLDGPPDIVDANVRRAAYNALTHGLRSHQVKEGVPSGLDLAAIVRSLEGGFTNKSRPVRLAAGYAQSHIVLFNTYFSCSRVLAELFKISQEAGEPAAARVASILSSTRKMLSARPDHAKETTLITLGLIGQ
jgi:hypothetical protein